MESRTDCGALWTRFNRKLAIELANALTDAGNAHAHVYLVGIGGNTGNPFSPVGNFQRDLIPLPNQADTGPFAAGVPVNVGEAFLNDAVYRQFKILRQTIQRRRYFQVDLNS